MSVSATNYVNSSFVNTSGSDRLPSKTLNQDDFLKLLVTQMSSQDPLNPKADMDMAAQMAQFTSLEQSRTMSGNIASMLSEQQVLQANGLLSREVKLYVDKDTTLSGVVTGVNFVSGQPMITVNGKDYSLDQVLSIAAYPTILE